MDDLLNVRKTWKSGVSVKITPVLYELVLIEQSDGTDYRVNKELGMAIYSWIQPWIRLREMCICPHYFLPWNGDDLWRLSYVA